MELGVGIQPVRKSEENVGNKALHFSSIAAINFYYPLTGTSFNTGLSGEDDNNDNDDIATTTAICNLLKIASNKYSENDLVR